MALLKTACGNAPADPGESKKSPPYEQTEAELAEIPETEEKTEKVEDSLGYTTTTGYVDPFYFICGLHTTEKYENDISHLSEEFSGEKARSVVEKVVGLVSSDGCLIGDGCKNAFKKSRSLFISHEFT